MIKNILTVGVSTLGSRILGLVRDILTFSILGTSLYASAFVFAFRLPNLFRRLLGEGALSSALVPTLSDSLGKTHSIQNMYAFLNRVITVLIPVLLLISLLGILILHTVEFFSESERWLIGSRYGKVLFPYVLLICLTAVLTAALNVLDRFLITSLSPIWLNLCMISSLVYASFNQPENMELQLLYLCIGVLIGGLLQLGFPLVRLLLLGWRPKLIVGRDERMNTLYRLFLPGLAGGAIIQVNGLISGILALMIDDSASAIIYLGHRLIELPLGLFTIAISTVVFPALARHISADRSDAFKNTFQQGSILILIMTLPSMIGLIILREPIVQLLFQWNEFNAEDVKATAAVTIIYALGLPFYSLTGYLTRGFHAQKDMNRPMKAAVISLILNTSLGLLFLNLWGMYGLASSTILSTFLMTLYLLHFFNQKNRNIWTQFFFLNSAKIIIASSVLGLACLVTFNQFDFTGIESKVVLAVKVFTCILISTLAYFAALYALKINPLTVLKQNND